MQVDTQAQNGESDEEGEVDLKDELISALEELEKCTRKNQKLNHVIIDLETQLLEAKRIEEDLNLQLKSKIQESEKLEEEIMQFKKKLDEEAMKSKFESASNILDDILNSQIPSNDKYGLGYRPKYYSFTNQDENKKGYVVALKIPVKKEERKKYIPNFHRKNKTNLVPKRSLMKIYQEIFIWSKIS